MSKKFMAAFVTGLAFAFAGLADSISLFGADVEIHARSAASVTGPQAARIAAALTNETDTNALAAISALKVKMRWDAADSNVYDVIEGGTNWVGYRISESFIADRSTYVFQTFDGAQSLSTYDDFSAFGALSIPTNSLPWSQSDWHISIGDGLSVDNYDQAIWSTNTVPDPPFILYAQTESATGTITVTWNQVASGLSTNERFRVNITDLTNANRFVTLSMLSGLATTGAVNAVAGDLDAAMNDFKNHTDNGTIGSDAHLQTGDRVLIDSVPSLATTQQVAQAVAPLATTQALAQVAATIQSIAPPQSVVSVNGQTGAVVITAAGIGALTNEQDLAALRLYHYGSDIHESPEAWFGFDPATGTITSFNWEAGRTNVVIPWAIDGSRVVEVGYKAFAETGITDIRLSKNTIKIGTNAFLACTSLKTIEAPSVEIICKGAFSITGGVLTTGIFPSVTYIDPNAFFQCTGIESLTFPVVKNIGYLAFKLCTRLSSIYFCKDAPITDAATFQYCYATLYVTNPSATGWGDTFGGRPVVRLPLYADEMYQAGERVPSVAAIQGIVYSNAVSQLTIWTNSSGSATSYRQVASGMTNSGTFAQGTSGATTLSGITHFGTNTVTLGSVSGYCDGWGIWTNDVDYGHWKSYDGGTNQWWELFK